MAIDWNNFVRNSKNGTFLLEREYMDYHNDRFQDASLLVINNKDAKVLAILPANLEGDSIYSHQGLTYGGLIIEEKVKLDTIIVFFQLILKHYALSDHRNFVYKPPPAFYHKRISFEDQYVMSLLEAHISRVDTTMVIPLKKERQYNQQKRRNIAKGKKSGLTIKLEQDISSFWSNVLEPNLKQRFEANPVHTITEISNLKSLFKNNIQTYAVYKEDQIIAGTILYLTETTVHTQYISANELGKQLCALDFLFDHLINLFELEKDSFSLGSTNQNEGKMINQGLYNWKYGFGAELYPNLYYTFPIKNRLNLDNFSGQEFL